MKAEGYKNCRQKSDWFSAVTPSAFILRHGSRVRNYRKYGLYVGIDPQSALRCEAAPR
jgi:hypothetical protein